MITLRQYLITNTLVAETYELFDYNQFATRFTARFGNRYLISNSEDIPKICQNVVDINKEFLTGLFAQTLNPYKAWGETGTSEHKGNADKISETSTTENKANTGDVSFNHTGTITHTDSGTIKDDGTQNSSGEDTSNDTGGINRYVNAYNTPTVASPESNDTTTATGHTTTSAEGTANNTQTRNLINTETRDYSDVETRNTKDNTTGSSNGTENTTTNDNDEYSKSGYNTEDYFTVMKQYENALDWLIDEMANLILVTVVPLWSI